MTATAIPTTARGSAGTAGTYRSRETRRLTPTTPRTLQRLPSAPRPDSSRDHLRLVHPAARSVELTPWRALLRAAQAARNVDVACGRSAPKEVARAFAYAVGYWPGQEQSYSRNIAGALLMGLSERGKLHVDVRECWRIWDELEQLHHDATAPSPRPRAPYQEENGRERIPVERARDVPIATVFGYLGHKLRATGAQRFTGRCPLPDHDDSTPSLSVDGHRGLWYCHGCHNGGDGIRLVQMLHHVGFRAAVEEIVSAGGSAC